MKTQAPFHLLLWLLMVSSPTTLMAGEDKIPFKIQTETLPNIVYRNETVNLRVNAYIDRPLPEDIATNPLAEIPITLTARIRTDTESTTETIDTLKAQLPPYSDTVFQGLFNIIFNDESERGELAFTIADKDNKEGLTTTVAFRPATVPGKDLTAESYELQTSSGTRAMLVSSRWDESSYRRWAVPITIARWMQAPEKGKVLLLAAEDPARRKPFHQTLQAELLRQNRELNTLHPQVLPAAPILLLLAEAGRITHTGEDTVIIDPGLADIVYGTPPVLFGQGIHALVTRLENLYDRDSNGFFLLLPALPPELSHKGAAYIKILRRLAEERHLAMVETKLPESAWGEAGERRYPLPSWQKEIARLLARKSNPARYQNFIYMGAGALLILLIIFIVIQIFTRRRLKRSIALSCSPISK